jgi:hypothetical protein
LQSRSGVGLPSYIQPKFEDFVDNQGLHNNVALPFLHEKASYKGKKKNYGNSNISPCKNVIFQKSSYKNRPIIIIIIIIII